MESDAEAGDVLGPAGSEAGAGRPDHQAGAGHDAIDDGSFDAGVDRLGQPEVVRVDDEDSALIELFILVTHVGRTFPPVSARPRVG